MAEEIKEGQSDAIAPKEEREAMAGEAMDLAVFPPVRTPHPPCHSIPLITL